MAGAIAHTLSALQVHVTLLCTFKCFSACAQVAAAAAAAAGAAGAADHAAGAAGAGGAAAGAGETSQRHRWVLSHFPRTGTAAAAVAAAIWCLQQGLGTQYLAALCTSSSCFSTAVSLFLGPGCLLLHVSSTRSAVLVAVMPTCSLVLPASNALFCFKL